MQVKIQFNLIDLSEIQKRDERVKIIRLLQKALLLVFERKWDFVVVQLFNCSKSWAFTLI